MPHYNYVPIIILQLVAMSASHENMPDFTQDWSLPNFSKLRVAQKKRDNYYVVIFH